MSVSPGADNRGAQVLVSSTHPPVDPGAAERAGKRVTAAGRVRGRVRPGWFRPRRSSGVLAVLHDGRPGRAEGLAAWVASSDAGAVVSVEPDDRVLILLPGREAALWVAPGDYLVRSRCGWPDWRTDPAEAFAAEFVSEPRELPVFSDGEVA